jgi:hypothetical protein
MNDETAMAISSSGFMEDVDSPEPALGRQEMDWTFLPRDTFPSIYMIQIFVKRAKPPRTRRDSRQMDCITQRHGNFYRSWHGIS